MRPFKFKAHDVACTEDLTLLARCVSYTQREQQALVKVLKQIGKSRRNSASSSSSTEILAHYSSWACLISHTLLHCQQIKWNRWKSIYPSHAKLLHKSFALLKTPINLLNAARFCIIEESIQLAYSALFWLCANTLPHSTNSYAFSK